MQAHWPFSCLIHYWSEWLVKEAENQTNLKLKQKKICFNSLQQWSCYDKKKHKLSGLLRIICIGPHMIDVISDPFFASPDLALSPQVYTSIVCVQFVFIPHSVIRIMNELSCAFYYIHTNMQHPRVSAIVN